MDRSPHAPDLQILHDVRARARDVTEHADLVVLDPDAVRAFARTLVEEQVGTERPVGAAPVDTDDPWAVADLTDVESATALVLALATINFGSGYHPQVRKRPGLSGARTMATGLQLWARDQPVTATRLARLSGAEAHEVFAQPVDDGPMSELMGLFAAALNDLGNLVLDDHDGSFVALVGAAGGSAAQLLILLDQLPFYRDVAAYRGRIVPFYKRAQLAACDLDRAFGGAGPGAFTDLADLTAFADNLVPHVLRVDGLLRYDPDLAVAIDAGTLVEPGSEAEVEIRAGGVHGVEEIRREMERLGVPIRSSELDMVLWWRGSRPEYKAVPRHRSRTVFY